jgi:tetratricopeptide (TPR) repeat protein
MRRIALLLLPLLVVACAGHEKRGDRAAAVGDWKTAERDYGEALRGDPGNADKRAKYATARERALSGAVAAARACVVTQDLECAFAEADYAHRLEPASAEIAALRAGAARDVGLLRLRQAADAGARRDHRAALDLAVRAREVSPDPAVQSEAARLAPSLVRGAVDEAQRQRAAQQYPQAIDLLTLAARLDGGVVPTLDAVRAEHERFLEAQYEGLAREGDALLREWRFAEAQARYEAALRVKKGGRAEPLARYARALAQGDQATRTKDFARATQAYEEAIRTGMDGSGFAAAALEKVRLRPYAVKVRTVLVKPVRPDGAPWAGNRSFGFERVVGLLAAAAFDGGGATTRAALRAYDALPHENRPNLVATITLPDGRRFATPARAAVNARLDSSVVVTTNHHDDRPVSIVVTHVDASGSVEIGAVTFRLSELLAAPELALRDRSVVDLRLAGEPSPLADGSVAGFVAIPPPGAIPAPGSPPAAR